MTLSPEQIKDEIAALKKLRREAPRTNKAGILAAGFIAQFDLQIHVLENGLTESQAYEQFQDRHSFDAANDACCWLSGAEPYPLSTLWAVLFGKPV